MKKIFPFLIALFAFMGCDDYNNVNIETLFFKVESHEWYLSGNPGEIGSYYYYEVPVRALDSYIYEKGIVTGNIFTNELIGNFNTEVQKPMPYTVYEAQNEVNSTFFWSEKYTYDFRPGYITFMVWYNDFQTGIRPPSCEYKITLSWEK